MLDTCTNFDFRFFIFSFHYLLTVTLCIFHCIESYQKEIPYRNSPWKYKRVYFPLCFSISCFSYTVKMKIYSRVLTYQLIYKNSSSNGKTRNNSTPCINVSWTSNAKFIHKTSYTLYIFALITCNSKN